MPRQARPKDRASQQRMHSRPAPRTDLFAQQQGGQQGGKHARNRERLCYASARQSNVAHHKMLCDRPDYKTIPIRVQRYRRKCLENGAPSRIRTWDLRLRRPLLYPTELRAPGFYIAPPAEGSKRLMRRRKCDGNRFYAGIGAESE